MGQGCQRSLQACCDPEGTATIVRKKKAQRAAINKYTELINETSSAIKESQLDLAQDRYEQILRYDREVAQKGLKPGDFIAELHAHKEWGGIENLRQDMESQYKESLR